MGRGGDPVQLSVLTQPESFETRMLLQDVNNLFIQGYNCLVCVLNVLEPILSRSLVDSSRSIFAPGSGIASGVDVHPHQMAHVGLGILVLLWHTRCTRVPLTGFASLYALSASFYAPNGAETGTNVLSLGSLGPLT